MSNKIKFCKVRGKHLMIEKQLIAEILEPCTFGYDKNECDLNNIQGGVSKEDIRCSNSDKFFDWI